MPRIAYHQHLPPRASATPALIALRDKFRAVGLELFCDFATDVFEVRRRRTVLARLRTLTAARRWLDRMS